MKTLAVNAEELERYLRERGAENACLGRGRYKTVLFLSALLFSQLAFTVPAAAQNAPHPDAWNMELVGASQNQGRADIGPYSKISPWPNPDGQYFYSGCYDPAPLDPRPEAAQCFMTISLKDPSFRNASRLYF